MVNRGAGHVAVIEHVDQPVAGVAFGEVLTRQRGLAAAERKDQAGEKSAPHGVISSTPEQSALHRAFAPGSQLSPLSFTPSPQ